MYFHLLDHKEGRIIIIPSPKLMTNNRQITIIEQHSLSRDKSMGNTSVAFKKAETIRIKATSIVLSHSFTTEY